MAGAAKDCKGESEKRREGEEGNTFVLVEGRVFVCGAALHPTFGHLWANFQYGKKSATWKSGGVEQQWRRWATQPQSPPNGQWAGGELFCLKGMPMNFDYFATPIRFKRKLAEYIPHRVCFSPLPLAIFYAHFFITNPLESSFPILLSNSCKIIQKMGGHIIITCKSSWRHKWRNDTIN
jgi:hypothetical protein